MVKKGFEIGDAAVYGLRQWKKSGFSFRSGIGSNDVKTSICQWSDSMNY